MATHFTSPTQPVARAAAARGGCPSDLRGRQHTNPSWEESCLLPAKLGRHGEGEARHVEGDLPCHLLRVAPPRRAELVARVAAHEGWEAADAGEPPLLLQYNDPFTPPWKRRNEVAVPVRRRGESTVQGQQPERDAEAQPESTVPAERAPPAELVALEPAAAPPVEAEAAPVVEAEPVAMAAEPAIIADEAADDEGSEEEGGEAEAEDGGTPEWKRRLLARI